MPLLVAAVVLFGSDFAAARDAPPNSAPRVIRVGPNTELRTIAEAARAARDGDRVEIEAGDYVGDVAVWSQKFLEIRGVNGRPRLIANGASAEAKGIWVIRGQEVVVENIEFRGARVPDKNGAGIRNESDRLVVRDCRFEDNENGILGGKAGSVLEIHHSEFVNNGAGDGFSHNLYVSGARVLIHGSYFSRARAGHLLKSRARETYVLYSRLTDETGNASYELEFPNGGLAVVIGNLIEQGPKTDNPTMISFGAEGYEFPRNELYLSHNTLVNDRSNGGVFVSVWKGDASLAAINNVMVGRGKWAVDVPARLSGSVALAREAFAGPDKFDYRMRVDSPLIGKAQSTELGIGVELRPSEEYVHVARSKRLKPLTPATPGAFQSLGRYNPHGTPQGVKRKLAIAGSGRSKSTKPTRMPQPTGPQPVRLTCPATLRPYQ
jgi:hypothetical protein